MKSFGTRELVALLEELGYTKGKQIASRHLKYHCPKKVAEGVHPFILVIQGRREYDPYWQRTYIKQIKAQGFTQEEIEIHFK
jgi:hypothetical protein